MQIAFSFSPHSNNTMMRQLLILLSLLVSILQSSSYFIPPSSVNSKRQRRFVNRSPKSLRKQSQHFDLDLSGGGGRGSGEALRRATRRRGDILNVGCRSRFLTGNVLPRSFVLSHGRSDAADNVSTLAFADRYRVSCEHS